MKEVLVPRQKPPRISWWVSLLIPVSAGLITLGHAGSDAVSAPEEPGQALTQELQLAIAPGELDGLFGVGNDGSTQFTLPRMRVYDDGGYLIFGVDAYLTDLLTRLAETVEHSKRVPGSRSLGNELSFLRTKEGARVQVEDLGVFDFSILTYEADWCEPCKQQLVDIRAFLASMPGLRIAFVRVDTDFRKNGSQRGAAAGSKESPEKPRKQE